MNRQLVLLLAFFRLIAKSSQQCKLSAPLGMITGAIQDWQISASSTYPLALEQSCHERYSRLYQPNNYAWCAKFKSNSEWLQIDLGVDTTVTEFAIQGRCNSREWVSAVMLSYSQDSVNWKFVVDVNGGQRVFEANQDSFSVKYLYLDSPINARFVKFHVVRWHRHPSMRVELFGCQVCRTLIGYPPFGRITASTQQNGGKSCSANDGSILSNRAWCAKSGSLGDWLQFDVGQPTRINGVVTKGRGDTKRKQWVSKYRVAYSNDTKLWMQYRDAPHLSVKVFAGNVDKDTERFHYLNQPFVARYVRIYPLDWNERASMRAGILGCPIISECEAGFFRLTPISPCVPNFAYRQEAGALNLRSTLAPLKRVSRENAHAGLIARVGTESIGSYRNSTQSECTTLQTFDSSLLWIVNLASAVNIRGAVLTLPQNGRVPDLGAIGTLKVSISEEAIHNNATSTSFLDNGKLCTTLTLYGRLQSRVLLQCTQEIRGKHVYLEVSLSSKPTKKPVSFTLCNLAVF